MFGPIWVSLGQKKLMKQFWNCGTISTWSYERSRIMYHPIPPCGTGVLFPGKQKGEKCFLFFFVTTYTDTYSLPRFMLFTQSTRLTIVLHDSIALYCDNHSVLNVSLKVAD